jgi:hypothetical protein
MVRGTGRYNVSRGLVSTIQGVGGSLSNVAGGTLVTFAGYGIALGVLALVAACALFLAVLHIPETLSAKRATIAGMSWHRTTTDDV